eukprot:2866931-Pleurochrysis_carterae.AAC.2
MREQNGLQTRAVKTQKGLTRLEKGAGVSTRESTKVRESGLTRKTFCRPRAASSPAAAALQGAAAASQGAS